MVRSLVLTVIGPDQPGLVEALARAVADHGGSWEESRMARLAGFFAGILEVRLAAERAPDLIAALEFLGQRGLKVTIEDAPRAVATPDYRVLQLELVGQDRPGIIREISSAMAAVGVNVVELETGCSSAPMSGETLFNVTAVLHHPIDRDVEELRETLEKIAGELMVDIGLDETAD
jgi:glycine cleavage system regulatory protein